MRLASIWELLNGHLRPKFDKHKYFGYEFITVFKAMSPSNDDDGINACQISLKWLSSKGQLDDPIGNY